MKPLSSASDLAILKRGLSRSEAAYIVGVSVDLFDKMVADGRMPSSRHINRRVLWDRKEIDEAFDKLFDRLPTGLKEEMPPIDKFSIVMA